MSEFWRKTVLWEALALAAMLLLALWLRLGWAGINPFNSDEATVSILALDMGQNFKFAWQGINSSAGVRNFPAAVWIFSLPYFFSSSALLATQFVGLLSALALLGLWGWVRRYWGRWAALAAGLYLAANPFSVFYARNIWGQNLLIPLGVLWLWLITYALQRRGWWIAAAIFVAGFSFQVHPAGLAFVLISGVLVLWQRWWRDWQALMLGVVLVLVALAPYLYYGACCDTNLGDQYRRLLLEGHSETDLDAINNMRRLALAQDWGFLITGELDRFSGDLLPQIAVGMLLGLGLLALARLAWKAESPHQRDIARLVLLWLLLAPLLFLRHSTPVFVHYQLVALPAFALLIGASTWVIENRAWGAGVVIIMTTVAGTWAYQVTQSLELAAHTATPLGLGTPLKVPQDLAQDIPTDRPVLAFMQGDRPMLGGEAAIWRVMLWDHPDSRIVDGNSVLILPPEPATLLFELPNFQAPEALDHAGLMQNAQQHPRRRNNPPYVLVPYAGGVDSLPGFTMLDSPIPWADGVQLEGWNVRLISERLRISTLWRVVDSPATTLDLRQFQHLRHPDNLSLSEPAFRGQDVPVANHAWRMGDQLVLMADFLQVAAGEYWVDIGHYQADTGQRIPRADGEGDSVRLGPFDWQGN